jgi:hypothetical protein
VEFCEKFTERLTKLKPSGTQEVMLLETFHSYKLGTAL